MSYEIIEKTQYGVLVKKMKSIPTECEKCKYTGRAVTLASVFIHRNTGEKLRIKKLHGTIATCESEITTVITEKPYLATNTVICKLENLILCG